MLTGFNLNFLDLVFHKEQFSFFTVCLTKEVNKKHLLMSNMFVKLIEHFIKFQKILVQDSLLNEVAGFYLHIVQVITFAIFSE